MPELIAKPALDGQLPYQGAGVTLSLIDPVSIWSVAPYAGSEKPAEKVLKTLGLAMPAPNRWVEGKAAARLVWTGRGQAFLFGAAPPPALAGHAALTDQSDGWTGLSLTGKRAAEALARLVPLDLRPKTFPPGAMARSLLGQVPLILLAETGGYALYIPRSMASSGWQMLAEVLDRLEARGR